MHPETETAPAEVKPADEPVSGKEMLYVAIAAVGLIVLCVAVWKYPTLFDLEGDGPSGRSGRRMLAILHLIWNRPVASIGGALGALLLVGTLFSLKKSKQP